MNIFELVIIKTISFEQANGLSKLINNGVSGHETTPGHPIQDRVKALECEWFWTVDEGNNLTGWRGQDAERLAQAERPKAVTLCYEVFISCWLQPFMYIRQQQQKINYFKNLVSRCSKLTGYDRLKPERGERKKLFFEIRKAIKEY